MTVPGDFDQLTRQFDGGSDLLGAFHAEEHRWIAGVQRGDPAVLQLTSTDVVARAWGKLTPAQQLAEMDMLFNAFCHNTMAVRKELELAEMAPDANTYLRDGDLSVIGDTLSGAMALSGEPLGAAFPDGMVPVDIDLLQRLVSELELLQHRLAMRDAAQAGDG
jgi:hypothetical protein